MEDRLHHLKIKVGGRDFHVSCLPGERENLLNAAQMLNLEISSIQNNSQSTSITLEAGAVIAALNFAAELNLSKKELQNHSGEAFTNDIDRLIGEIDSVLDN